MAFASGFGNPYGLAIRNPYIYVANSAVNSISQVNLNTASVNINYISIPRPQALLISGQYLYASSVTTGIIYRIDLANNNTITTVASGIFDSSGLAISGTYLYASAVLNRIHQIDLTNGNVTTFATVTGGVPTGLAIRGQILYAACSGDNTIRQIDLTSGSVTTFMSSILIPQALTIDGSYLYVTIFPNVIRINLDTGDVISVPTSSVSSPGVGVFGYYLYTFNGNSLFRFQLAQPQPQVRPYPIPLPARQTVPVCVSQLPNSEKRAPDKFNPYEYWGWSRGIPKYGKVQLYPFC